MKVIILFALLYGCADLTPSGARVKFVESEGDLADIQEIADKMAAEKNCSFMGYVDAKTSVFPGSYSVHENEIHSALRNRAAKVGANVVIANFYKKPAQGAVLKCPEEI